MLFHIHIYQVNIPETETFIRKKQNVRRLQNRKKQAIRAARYKMSEYDGGAELCPVKQVTLQKDNLSKSVVVYDLETARLRRENDILQVKIIAISYWYHMSFLQITQ